MGTITISINNKTYHLEENGDFFIVNDKTIRIHPELQSSIKENLILIRNHVLAFDQLLDLNQTELIEEYKEAKKLGINLSYWFLDLDPHKPYQDKLRQLKEDIKRKKEALKAKKEALERMKARGYRGTIRTESNIFFITIKESQIILEDDRYKAESNILQGEYKRALTSTLKELYDEKSELKKSLALYIVQLADSWKVEDLNLTNEQIKCLFIQRKTLEDLVTEKLKQ